MWSMSRCDSDLRDDGDWILILMVSGTSQTIRKIGSSPFVLVVESFNQKTGVSISLRFKSSVHY